MADNFGLKIGLEGEKEFKKALSEINQSFKVLGSEMKLVSSQFDKNDSSVQALTARNTVLNKEIEAQKQKIETLRSALDNASASFGENDRRTQNWQIQLNNAEAALNDMERELKQNQDAIDEMQDQLTIVYTPLHGTGNVPARRVLKELGFTHVYVVPEQELPDGEFPTVSYPNPEAAEAFELALALAKEKNADLVLATDPDADRLGVYVKDAKTGEYHSLTGNMSGCLLAEYTISQIKEKKGLPEDGALIKTIVTTNLADAIAKSYGIRLIECLTGFKYIGQQILGFEQSGKGTYLFGFEESYGCLIGTHARDKDAIVATMALCEAAAYYKKQGKTLWDQMLAIYDKYGYYKDSVKSVTMKGIEGLAKIAQTMENLRANAPENIGPYKVLQARDYKLDTCKNMETGEVTPTGLPQSNVLYYDLEDGAWLCVRPSGTEPKIKLYYGVKGSSMEDAENRSAELGKYAEALLGS